MGIIDTSERQPTFEETYTRVEFSELIYLSLVLTDAILRLSQRWKLQSGQPASADPTQAA